MKILLRILKWIVIVLMAIFLLIFVLDIVPFSLSNVKNNVFRSTEEYPLVIPHGGAKKLAPENTVYAYDMLVYEFKADVLEIDLAMTKDNILIAHHNLDLEFSSDSLLNGKLIKDYTYAEILKEYQDDNYYLAREFKYPDDYLNGIKPFENETNQAVLDTLVPANIEDVFTKVGDSVLYILEIKDSPSSINYEEGSMRFEEAAQKLIDLVKKYNLEENVLLASFSDEVTAYFKENAPDILIGAANDEVTNFSVISAFHLDFFWGVKSHVLILPNQTSMSPITGSTARLLDKLPSFIRDSIGIKDGEGYRPNLMHSQLVNDAHRKNMAVIYWTINDPEEMKHLVNIGADGIITDRPDLLRKVIEEMKND